MKIDKILERFKQHPEYKMSEYLDVDAEMFKAPSAKLVGEVRELGGDLDWWFPPKARLSLCSPEPTRGTSIQDVIKGMGYNFETVDGLVNLKVKRDLKFALGVTVEAMGARPQIELYKSRGSPPIDFRSDEMRKLAVEYFKDHQKNITDAFQTVRARLEEMANDVVVWVCEMLKEHGHNDVDVKTYFWASAIFIRLYQARTKMIYEEVMRMFGG